MEISVFALMVLALCATAVLVLGADRWLSRRLQRPALVQAAVAGAAAVLLPANVYCAMHGNPEETGVLGLCVLVATLLALGTIAILVMRLRVESMPARLPRRVLAIGAHPDDLELGCGGTLAKLADSGHELHAIVMSAGELGGDRSARPREAVDGGRFVGAAGLEVLGFSDTRLADHELEMVVAIERALRRFNPDIILTHSASDQHQDHLAVHMATLRAARQHSAILCYESPSTTQAFRPSVFIDIEDYVGIKTAAIAAHRDQRDKPYMTPERVRGLASFRGGQAKVRHAEGYEPVRLLGSLEEL